MLDPMKTISLLLLSVLLAGCHVVSIPTQHGAATIRSFGQRTKISELTFDNGKLRLKGYNNDQLSALMEAFSAGKAAGAAAAGIPMP